MTWNAKGKVAKRAAKEQKAVTARFHPNVFDVYVFCPHQGLCLYALTSGHRHHPTA